MLRLMTTTLSLAALTALSLTAGAALAAEPVTIAPIQIGAELADKADDIGEREFDRLRQILRGDLERELAGHLGENGSTLYVTILDATPNRPTLEQLSATPGLSMESISIGGASIEAELVSASGEKLQNFSYSWQSYNIVNVVGSGTWTDARRAFNRFAGDVGNGVEARDANPS
ncbi:hypothetical protein [uncultured Maricaulis sp.]|uniref:hypothetical protein n=1 Tax=uncultured Maricaulis sp. TaxID=174710 RepID=UPI0030DBC8E6